MNQLGLAMGREAYAHALRHNQAQEFTLLGRPWQQLDGVLGGDYNYATGLFASSLPYSGVRSMLEMGCGCGVAAVLGALAGVPAVTAVDINPAAVRTTRLNAERHGVADRVTSLVSDLFTAVPEGATYDLVYWNSPFIQAPAGQRHESDLAYHFFDPGYAMHERFLHGAAERLTPDGRLFLGFSFAMGSEDRLREVAAVAGFAVTVFAQETFAVPAAELGASPVYAAHADDDARVHLDFTLLELTR